MKTTSPTRVLVLALALVASVPTAYAGDVIQNGSDLWRTLGDGTTYAKFDTEPIPAGFFCSGSAPFEGRVIFEGVPIVTSPSGAFGPTDTIVHRLDDAVFNQEGVAHTRIQMRAMQFKGVDVLRNECGEFTVGLVLDGSLQPVTRMAIHRLGPDHGYFVAEISANVRITFTPKSAGGEALELTREVRFPPARNVWSTKGGEGAIVRQGFVLADTNGDGRADNYVPGTSANFAAGWRPDGAAAIPMTAEELGQLDPIAAMLAAGCHEDPCGLHCPSPPWVTATSSTSTM